MSVRSTIFRKTAAWLLTTCLLALLMAAPVLAWDDDDIVGDVKTLTPSNTQNGSLTDDSGLGAAVADAAAYACETDFAVLCGGDLAGNLAPGAVTWKQLRFVFTEDRELAICTVTAAELRTLLEFCLSHMTVDETTLAVDRAASAFDAFPQVSGFSVRYDVSAPVGERVLEIVADGEGELSLDDSERTYTLACTQYLLSGGYGPLDLSVPGEDAGMTECEALAAYVAAGQMGDYTDAERVRAIGSVDSSLVKQFGLDGFLLPLCIIVALAMGLKYRAKNARVRSDDEPTAP